MTVSLVLAAEIADTKGEIDVEVTRHGERIAVGDAGAVAPVVGDIAFAAKLEVVGEHLSVYAYVMTAEA